MQVVVARDVAGAARTGTHCPQRLFHRRQDSRMLPHAEIVVGAPDSDLGADAMVKGTRKAAAASLEISKDAVTPLGAQRAEALFEEAFVVHYRHGHPDQRILTDPQRPATRTTCRGGGAISLVCTYRSHAPAAATGKTANTSRWWNRSRPCRRHIPAAPPPEPHRANSQKYRNRSRPASERRPHRDARRVDKSRRARAPNSRPVLRAAG